MCRMVGIVSQRPQPVAYELVQAPHSLLWLSRNGLQPYTGQRGPHSDGWGLAWRQGGMKLIKSGRPAGEDPQFPRQAATIETDLLLAHARLASDKKTVSPENAHPFERDGLFLAHNGYVADLPGELPVDSQRLLVFLAERWDGTAQGLATAVREARSFRYTSLSFLMTDGRDLYALREVRPKPQFLQYYTLYIKQSEDKTVVASEPLDEVGGWELIPNGTLLAIGAGGEVERLEL